jgi:hypothetical protein
MLAPRHLAVLYGCKSAHRVISNFYHISDTCQ